MTGGDASRVAALGHQRLGDRAVQVALASRFVVERVEDREGGRAEPEREPDGVVAS